MADSVTSALTEVSETIVSYFTDTNKMLFMALVIILFLTLNNVIIYLVYVKLRNRINNYCEGKFKKNGSK
jgi:hypothetical protein